MRIGIAADHGGFELKVQLTAALKTAGYELADLGAHELDTPEFCTVWTSTGILVFGGAPIMGSIPCKKIQSLPT